jgi:FkbM family methyltransferase
MKTFKKIIKEVAPPILISTIKKFKSSFIKPVIRSDRKFNMDGIDILLPADHKLDLFQKIFPTYDKFITIIPKYLSKDSIVIDIGANVGDSAIPFLKENIKTVCVEPSSLYVEYLRKNIEDNNFSELTIIVKKLISTKNSKTNLAIKDGTATSNVHHEESTLTEEINDSISLDHLMKNYSKVSLVKIDTDGFDFDVINSGKNFFTKNKPLIFFENYINETNEKDYDDMYTFLEKAGYENISIFNNRGMLIIHNASWRHLRNLNNYMRMDTVRSIGYTDVFCYQDVDKQTADIIVSEFVQKFM